MTQTLANPNFLNHVIERLDQAEDLRNSHWCMPTEACRLLYLLASLKGAQTICEIGTSIGYSTLWLAEAAKKNNGKLYTIEASDERQNQAIQHIKEAKLETHVEFLLGDAAACLTQLQSQNIRFNMAFIDASKMQYMSYYQALTPMLNPDGLFIADNTMSHRNEMLDFISAIKNDPQYLTCDIDTANGLIIAQKRA